jgi:Phage QLRG family, putative DNA packaging.
MVWRPDYATTAQVKAFLGITDSVDDTEIASAITAASRTIDRATSRQFGKSDTATARSYNAVWDRHRPTPAWVVMIDDLFDATGLVVTIGGVTVTAANYTLEEVNALADGKVYTSLVFGASAEAKPSVSAPRVDMTTDKWGWPAVPVAILGACKLQTGRFHKRKDALFGVAGSPQDGSEVRLLAQIDPDVRVMLSDYVRRWGAV